MAITFSTCWYIFKAKFDPSVYRGWIHNMLSNVHAYNLVVYCDEESYAYIAPYVGNPRIKAVIKSPKEFSTYHLREQWIANHEHNVLLNGRTGWELNMLWCEKLHFVKETIKSGWTNDSERFSNDSERFSNDSERFSNDSATLYGWLDIGYFRGRPNDLTADELTNWPSADRLRELDHSKIYYACVNNNASYLRQMYHLVNDRNECNLPRIPIPDQQVSIAGGFFLGTAENLLWWHDTFYALLMKYMVCGRLVKDDQILVADGVFNNLDRFHLCQEEDARYDNWFLFQRYLT
jgi:hypothetical protein